MRLKLPVVNGLEQKWMCFYCYAMIPHSVLPSGWDLVFGLAICPECAARIPVDGGIEVVKAGAYATGPDPRIPTDEPR